MAKTSDFLPIEDYFIIGDLRTAALVSRSGSIDWLCLPCFDSPSVFGKMLDAGAGCLSIDMPGFKIDADYIDGSAIVEFGLSKPSTELSIKDFMVPQATKNSVNQYLVRTITGLRGEAIARFRFDPKPKYASVSPSVRQTSQKLELPVDGGLINLHLPDDSKVNKKADYYEIAVPVKAGEQRRLIIEYIPKGRKPGTTRAGLEEKTAKFWKQWVSKGNFFDFCQTNLVRSAITLKLMQFYPTGAIVAAPTTSLPETIGGVRNWDYRYTWIRDATFALYSFYALGYSQEAEHFFKFIEKVTEQCAGEKFDVSLMYTIWGEPIPEEQSLTNLSGYKDSAPVRIGNGASRQFQLDVYGALIDAFYFASKHGFSDTHKKRWRKIVMQLVRKIDELWQEPDHGIWEARVGTKHYTYSKVMAWVGADRANRLKKTLNLTDEDLMVCRRLSESIKDWIWRHGYDESSQNLVQHSRSKAIDATNLLFVLLQFLDKHHPLTKKIVDNTANELGHGQVFVYRYLKADGLPGEEGAFILCSFWLISALAILEDVESAIKLFRRFDEYMNPQGLLSEEVDPESKRYLGNYPQAFSHMGYIMSAHYIHKYAKRKNIKLK